MIDQGSPTHESVQGASATPRASTRDRVIDALLSPFLVMLRLLPLGLLPIVTRVLADLTRLLARRDVAILRRNVRGALGIDPRAPEARRLEREFFRHAIACAFETVRCSYDPSILQVDGKDEALAILRPAEAAGRGHVLATAHLGAWELVGIAGALGRKRFYAVGKPAPTEKVTGFLRGMRERIGDSALWAGERSFLRQMMRVLKRGEVLGIVMDQKPENRRGPVVTFFGQPTEFVGGPAALTARTGCALSTVFAYRCGPFHYRLEAREILPANHGETDEQMISQRLASAIEAAIRRAPEQWAWNYRRWYWDELEDSRAT